MREERAFKALSKAFLIIFYTTFRKLSYSLYFFFSNQNSNNLGLKLKIFFSYIIWNKYKTLINIVFFNLKICYTIFFSSSSLYEIDFLLIFTMVFCSLFIFFYHFSQLNIYVLCSLLFVFEKKQTPTKKIGTESRNSFKKK